MHFLKNLKSKELISLSVRPWTWCKISSVCIVGCKIMMICSLISTQQSGSGWDIGCTLPQVFSWAPRIYCAFCSSRIDCRRRRREHSLGRHNVCQLSLSGCHSVALSAALAHICSLDAPNWCTCATIVLQKHRVIISSSQQPAWRHSRRMRPVWMHFHF